MSLTLNEVKFLLGHAMGYDNRKIPGDANLTSWVEAARRARWTLPAALEALHEHYAHSADFLMPGHITARIRAGQNQPPPIREVLDARPDPIGQARLEELTAAAFKAIAPAQSEPQPTRRSELDRPCPFCDAKPREHCTRRGLTGRVRLTKPHPSRTQEPT